MAWMEERDAKERASDFGEVGFGFSEKQAGKEASRCLQCPTAPCVGGCPAGIDIKGFISELREGRVQEAMDIIGEKNCFPGVCGRVCEQETQCEGRCVLAKAGKPIRIGALERFVSDNADFSAKAERKSGKTAGVIGAGPAGLTAARELADAGIEVTVYDSLKELGGVMKYGIPCFRLPKDVLCREIGRLKEGINFILGKEVGRDIGFDELVGKYDAVFIGTGAGKPRKLGVDGEENEKVLLANHFLREYYLGKKEFDLGKKVVVIGAGNVAMDAARTALRLGSKVTVMYRKGREMMKARGEEIRHAEEEGVEFIFNAAPVRFLGGGKVKAVFGVGGKEKEFEFDSAIVAIGQTPNGLAEKAGLERESDGRIKVDSKGMSSKEGVFSAGDCVLGSASVVEAIADAKKVSKEILAWLGKQPQ